MISAMNQNGQKKNQQWTKKRLSCWAVFEPGEGRGRTSQRFDEQRNRERDSPRPQQEGDLDGFPMALLGRVRWLGGKLFEGIEWVGETVVSVLGLDDSRYQDILDNMTPREMQIAENIHAQREEEYRIYNENTSNSVLVESGGLAAEPEESDAVVDVAAVQLVEMQPEEQEKGLQSVNPAALMPSAVDAGQSSAADQEQV